MAAEYDRKFEEMKKYVPFLESMIKRLESTTAGSSNPRQAQLDKIRSLRDLLLDKKKRMKMDNLLKCEQVLVNLYAKVEQRDTFSIPPKSSETINLEVVRNKLKTVIKQEDEENPETLPEIARANESQDNSTAGSKEPALFQRRPNMASPGRSVTRSPPGSATKRNYTRVLVSPEPSHNRWLKSDYAKNEKPLFSRRSPRWSPNRVSPVYSRKERKKPFKQSHSPRKSKDLNITLKVPEESLNSLNTKDILSRIINCHDSDVDIDSLRVLRTQILGELKHTGIKDDISDLILNSTGSKKKKKKKPKQKQEVEEGELSDSQSEAIKDIYGSLVILDKDQSSGQSNVSNNEEQKQNRKIQIRLVINSESTAAASTDETTNSKTLISDLSDFEMYKSKTTEVKNDAAKNIITNKNITTDKNITNEVTPKDTNKSESKEITTVLSRELIIDKSHNKNEKAFGDDTGKKEVEIHDKNVVAQASNEPCSTEDNTVKPKKDAIKIGVSFTPNFYTPLIELESNSSQKSENPDRSDNKKCGDIKGENRDTKTETSDLKISLNVNDVPEDASLFTKTQDAVNENPLEVVNVVNKTHDAVEIPLLNEPSVVTQKPNVVSEIDILQALKNEILSESITIPGTNTITPALHQPKLTKVASTQEIAPKKRISIEKYKEKSVGPVATPLFKTGRSMSKEDHIKRQSLKLTEKEYERFKLDLHRDLSSDDDYDNNDDTSINDIYSNLAPKSPDNNDENDLPSKPPVIIPEEPVKNVIASSKSDVDMRTLLLILSPHLKSGSSLNSLPSQSPNTTSSLNVPKEDHKRNNLEKKTPVDPRLKRDMNQINTQNESVVPRPVPPVHFSSMTSVIAPPGAIQNITMTPCMTPNVVPSMTPNMIPSMTPSMTPNSRTFQIDDQPTRKHVYTTLFDPRDYRDQSITRDIQSATRDKPEKSKESSWESREDKDWTGSPSWQDRPGRSNPAKSDPRDYQNHNKYTESYDYYKYKNSRGDRSEVPSTPSQFIRSDCPSTPSHSYSRSECPLTPSHSFGRSDCPPTPNHSFGRSDCPSTPIHPFGRSDCPPTPSHPFGRSDCPSTPIHPFGRSDCPPTPSHPYGRSDCPLTPSHPFGRSECPPTPSHPYSRPECPLTPSHSFGRTECPPTPSNSFGRTDMPITNSRSLSRMDRDPRLKRNDDRDRFYHDRDRFHYDRDRTHYKDRNTPMYNSYQQDKQYADNYRNYRERSIGQNERSKYYSKEYDEYNYKQERIPPSDKYGGVSRSDNYERDDKYSKGNNSNFDYDERNKPMRYNEKEPRTSNYRERSIGRTMPPEVIFVRSNSRARSVGRHCEGDADNTFSIKSHSGRPFTIDTSVNSTFQSFIKRDKDKSVFEHIFDNRKQRATSVGRSSVRETSVGPALSRSFNPIQNNDRRNNDFRRARSVVRDIEDPKPNQTFSELKADFEAFKTKLNINTQKHINLSRNPVERNESPCIGTKSEIKDNTTSKNQVSASQQSYSPRKNSRDPRLHRDKYSDMKNRHKDDKYKYSDLRDKKKYGIDYSNENIARGTVLETGFGVKNYKIPKIKRAVEEDLEKKTEDSKEVSKEKKIEKISSVKVTEQLKKPSKDKSKDSKSSDASDRKEKQSDNYKFDDTEKKVLRPGKKYVAEESKASNDEIIPKTRKSKRHIRHSESESEDGSKTDVPTETDLNSGKTSNANLPENKNKHNIELASNFGDDLEIFADNVISDPVMDTIHALIAGLDDDISTSKNEDANNFRKEISVENMLENISSPLEDNCNESPEDVILQDINEYIRQDLNKGEESVQEYTSVKSSVKAVDENKIAEVNTQDIETLTGFDKSPADKAEINKIVTDTSVGDHDEVFEKHERIQTKGLKTQNSYLNEQVISKDNNEDIVSTTDAETEQSNKLEAEHKNGNCSTPDSTHNENILAKVIPEESLPDQNILAKVIPEETLPDSSTNEIQNEIPHVTSSRDTGEHRDQQATEATTNKIDAPDVDSIESILFLLKNKAKMKELLNKLEQQSCDNDRVKKKLERLSEIVSDDEDSNGEKQELLKNNIEESICGDSSSICEKNVNDINGDKIESLYNVSSSKFEEKDEESVLVENEQKKTERTPTRPGNKISAKKRKQNMKRNIKSTRKNAPKGSKRATRSETNSVQKGTPKNKESRELLRLQEDIKEMFISDDILKATGIRMCRIAKLVDEKVPAQKVAVPLEPKPVVVLEKVCKDSTEESHLHKEAKTTKVLKRKPGLKSKAQVSLDESSTEVESKQRQQSKPGLKYKPKYIKKPIVNQHVTADPYAFETDSINESNTSKRSDDSPENSSDSEDESLTSLKSYASSEVLAELKRKPKRKRSSWKSGVIKPKHKKKKIEQKQDNTVCKEDSPQNIEKHSNMPDFNCFTDKTYCFTKNVTTYSCRLCVYSGDDIVAHYKKHHPHSEVPLSRLSPEIAKQAIDQCEQLNTQAISKIPTKRLVCRFCNKEFSKNKSALEAFFWHVVSTHTGEYKQLCSECVNTNRCPFNLDIPPPPKDVKGQLIGYICGKCNFTQISLENLKTHVIARHNDDQTAVYTINLAVMSRKLVNILLKRTSVPKTDQSRVLRSSRSNISMTETSDDRSDCTDTNEVKSEPTSPQINRRTRSTSFTRVKCNMKSKFTFENDDSPIKTTVKMEQEDQEEDKQVDTTRLGEGATESDTNANEQPVAEEASVQLPVAPVSDDIFAYPHFKIWYTATGSKEFVCCINGQYHYKTTLLISMKKHVQHKHSENWDGYCFVCKVIVMPQGRHHFKDCLEHFLDQHMGEFPVMEKIVDPEKLAEPPVLVPPPPPPQPVELAPPAPPRSYINVRPISQLQDPIIQEENPLGLPKIESVVSLGDPSEQNLSYSASELPPQLMEDFNKYEQAQIDVMSKKHPVVLDTMLKKEKLVKVFKCAGSYCSFTTDNADVALIHALCHQQIGGENAMKCAYCDFDTTENAIDLVVHVFKHATCQIVCGYCFYRAACGQLVVAHTTRAHPGKPPQVLAATNAIPAEKDTTRMLPRNIAVKYYVCNQADTEVACSFRTYIAGKFCEHLEQRHEHATEYNCYICFASVSSADELIQHMKCHDLNLYQCTWCTHGANNESDLLDHSSAKHPTKHPHAFLRIITNKGGSSEFRVLPLASFNKNTIYTEEVTPNSTSENPTKEAERSLELEKLIGTTKAMFENMTASTSQTQNTREGIETYDLDQDIVEESLLHQKCSLTTSPVTPNPATQKPQLVTENPVTQNIATQNSTAETEKEKAIAQKPVTQNSVSQENDRTSLPQTAEVVNKTVPRVSSPVINSTCKNDSEKGKAQDPPIISVVDDGQRYTRHNESVVCVESDDETSKHTVIDLSDDDDVTQVTIDPLSTPPIDPLSTASIDPGTPTVDLQSTPTVEPQNEPTVDAQSTPGIGSQSTSTEDSQSTPTVESQSTPTVESQSTSTVDPQITSIVDPQTSVTVDSQTTFSVNPTNSLKQSADPAGFSKQLVDPVGRMTVSDDKMKAVHKDILYKCPKCKLVFKAASGLKVHILYCFVNPTGLMPCAHCGVMTSNRDDLITHYMTRHTEKPDEFICGTCQITFANLPNLKRHMKTKHKVTPRLCYNVRDGQNICVAEMPAGEPEVSAPRQAPKRKCSTGSREPPQKFKRYGPQDVDQLPINPILDELVSCSLCEFKTKVRLNLVRHLQLHADQQPVPQTAPVNPVPHLETNEMHFDRMVNLASSSIATRGPAIQTKPDAAPVVSLHIPPEAATRYPKYVPDRQRHTCGAKGCSYISVDETMLRCHWDTLHSGTNDFHCVHCPPNQHLDTSKPLTASRIIAHLKMHDTALYACSACVYYHYKRQSVEKHVNDVHKEGQVMVVRDEATSQSTSTGSNAAPTMDLKPWQCGLCKFKSMLRPEVAEHCAKVHSSKMQYKCSYCPFRTSTLENVVKHQSNAHSGKVQEVFYYYYREGSVPDEADGTPLWVKQRQKTGTVDTEVKTEVQDNCLRNLLVTTAAPPPLAVNIDLNIVKKEVDTRSLGSEQTIEELCKTFGEFCEPNGLKYKCCLCKVVTEDTKEAMQSHMYEELQYRKWQCSVCSYKAFHKTGLHDHMASEHRGQGKEPVELPIDGNMEKWVFKMLEHQAQIINKSKENFAKQKIQTPSTTTSPSKALTKPQPQRPQEISDRPKPSMKELEQAFGLLGVANNMQFCCPKCVFRSKDESAMKDHLEGELSKIRWCCSVCSENFTTYHEVQFHCKSVHDGQSARPKEAIRDPAMRAAWVAGVIQVQKLSMNCMPVEPLLQPSPQKQPPEPDNSLLVVRFEENVPIPEGAAKKRPLPQSPDSDEERLVIDDVAPKRTATSQCHKCLHCPFQSKYGQALKTHIFRHYNMRPYGCQHCEFTGLSSSKVYTHIRGCHPNKPLAVKTFSLPSGPPPTLHVQRRRSNGREDDLQGCMVCKTILSVAESLTHKHGETLAIFAKHGDVVYRCSKCLLVRKDIYSMQIHYRIHHPNDSVNDYTKNLVRLYQGDDPCTTVQFINFDIPLIDLDDSTSHSEDSTANLPPKRVAKKSTTKLPMQTVARKSTTKLPFYAPPECEEYSYYGTKPTPLSEFGNVTTMMPFCNTVVPFTMQRLSEIINIQPNVTVKDNEK